MMRVDITEAKVSDEARVKRLMIAEAMMPTSSAYQDPATKGAFEVYIADGKDFMACQADVVLLEAKLGDARGKRDAKRITLDESHCIVVVHVEKQSETEGDVKAAGFEPLQKAPIIDEMPSAIILSSVPGSRAIECTVKYASKCRRNCIIQATQTPSDPASYRELAGHGVQQTVSDCDPGVWYVRALTLRSKKRSPWFGPVTIVVK